MEVKEVKRTMFVCPECGNEFTTKKEALQCAKSDAFYQQLCEIRDNSNFRQTAEDFDVDDIDDVEFKVEPEDASCIEEVKKVSIIQQVRGWQTIVFERKQR